MARNLKTQNTLNKLKKKSPYASLTDVVNDLNVLGTELDSSVKVTSSAQGVAFDAPTTTAIAAIAQSVSTSGDTLKLQHGDRLNELLVTLQREPYNPFDALTIALGRYRPGSRRAAARRLHIQYSSSGRWRMARREHCCLI